MCRKQPVEVRFGFCDGPRRKAEDVVTIEQRSIISIKLPGRCQEREAIRWIALRGMPIVVMDCECGDPARDKDKASNVIQDLAWHLEEVGWLVVHELGLAFVRHLAVENSSWLCYEVMGEEVGMSVRFVALGWPIGLKFFAHHAPVE